MKENHPNELIGSISLSVQAPKAMVEVMEVTNIALADLRHARLILNTGSLLIALY